MKNVCSSLVALALVALKNGEQHDAARFLSQASVAPDSDAFLEDVLTDNYQASVMVESVSSSFTLSESIAALSASLEVVAQTEQSDAMYGDDDFHSVSSDDDDDIEVEEEIDFGFGDEDDEEDPDLEIVEDDQTEDYFPSESTSGIKLRRK